MPAPKVLLTNEMVAKMVEAGMISTNQAADFDTVEKQALRAVERDKEKKEQAIRDAALAVFSDDLTLLIEELKSTPIIRSAKSDWTGWTATSDCVKGYHVKVIVTAKK